MQHDRYCVQQSQVPNPNHPARHIHPSRAEHALPLPLPFSLPGLLLWLQRAPSPVQRSDGSYLVARSKDPTVPTYLPTYLPIYSTVQYSTVPTLPPTYLQYCT